MVIAIIGILASMLLPTLQKARERARQIRCMTNLKQIYIAMVEYGNDHDDCIVPFRDNAGLTWDNLLKPYTKGGGSDPHFRTELDHKSFYDYMLFYCPTRWAMGTKKSNSGWYTNYGASVFVMCDPRPPASSDPWNPNSGSSNLAPWELGLRKFSDFKYAGLIGIMFETGLYGHVASPGTSASGLQYVHNENTNVLFLDGNVQSFRRGSSAAKNIMMTDDRKIQP